MNVHHLHKTDFICLIFPSSSSLVRYGAFFLSLLFIHYYYFIVATAVQHLFSLFIVRPLIMCAFIWFSSRSAFIYSFVPFAENENDALILFYLLSSFIVFICSIQFGVYINVCVFV